jgi:hypothetical protein
VGDYDWAIKKHGFKSVDGALTANLDPKVLLRVSATAAICGYDSGRQSCPVAKWRTALWQVERAARPAGPLLGAIPEQMELSSLEQMTDEERFVADFHGSGMSTGPHPMTYCRGRLYRGSK